MKKKTADISISLRIESDLRKAIEEAAAADNRTMAAYIKNVLRVALAKDKAKR